MRAYTYTHPPTYTLSLSPSPSSSFLIDSARTAVWGRVCVLAVVVVGSIVVTPPVSVREEEEIRGLG
jgi:hypothetical protein